MRGALEPIGVEIVGLEADKQSFDVKYDPSKTQIDTILAALQAAGEPATKR